VRPEGRQALCARRLSAAASPCAPTRVTGIRTRSTLWTHEGRLAAGALDRLGSLGAAIRDSAAVLAMTISPFEGGTDAEIAQDEVILAAATQEQMPQLVFSFAAGRARVVGCRTSTAGPSSKPRWAWHDPVHDPRADLLLRQRARRSHRYPRRSAPAALAGRSTAAAARPTRSRRVSGRGAHRPRMPNTGQTDRSRLRRTNPTQIAQALSVALGRKVAHEQTDLDDIDSPDLHAMWRFLARPATRPTSPPGTPANPGSSGRASAATHKTHSARNTDNQLGAPTSARRQQ
jgi:hypothetical protein